MIEVEVSTRGLEFNVAETLDKDVRRMLVERLAEVAYYEVFYGAPWKTGKLARSIIKEIDEDGKATIRALAPHAIHVVKGTVPHEIRPVNASCLAFEAAGGDTVFTRLVRHPGTKPNPFLQRVVDKARENVEEVFAELFTELIT